MEHKTVEIISQEKLTEDIMSLWISWEPDEAVIPGQFINVYLKDPSRMLPRPISICDVTDKGLRMVYRITGAATGTKELSGYKPKEKLRITGPVGRGYPVEELKNSENVVLMGGGIGIPPMLYLAKSLGGRCKAVLGYRDSSTFLKEEFDALGCRVLLSSDDGSVGVHGTVLDAIAADNTDCGVICACGPKPMLRGIKDYASSRDIKAYISLEERMACGVGACLGCVTKTQKTDDHSRVKNARVCVDGPVFLAGEVAL